MDAMIFTEAFLPGGRKSGARGGGFTPPKGIAPELAASDIKSSGGRGGCMLVCIPVRARSKRGGARYIASSARLCSSPSVVEDLDSAVDEIDTLQEGLRVPLSKMVLGLGVVNGSWALKPCYLGPSLRKLESETSGTALWTLPPPHVPASGRYSKPFSTGAYSGGL